jgi:hypothetical protein
MTFGGTHRRKFVGDLPEEVEHSSNPPQGKMNCKVEAHVDAKHVFSSFQREMTALLAQGRVAFGNLGFPLARPIAHQ